MAQGPASNTTALTPAQSSLAWESVIWAFVPITLNAMTQPSGRVLGFPSSWNFAIRCSPIVCFASVVHSLYTIMEAFSRTLSVKQALELFAAERFEDSSEDDKSEGSFTSLRKNIVIRIGLLGLGALPQAIKLYAAKSIPWTQAPCSVFLATFIIDELLLAFAPRPERETSKAESKHQKFPIGVALWSGMSATYAAFAFIFSRFLTINVSQSKHHLTFVASSTGVTAVTTVLSVLPLLWESLNPEALGQWTFIACTVIAPTLLSGVPIAIGHAILPEFSFEVLIGASLLLCLGCLMLIAEVLLRCATATQAERLRVALGILFVLWHLAAALFYYIEMYDPSTALKPGWTDMLG